MLRAPLHNSRASESEASGAESASFRAQERGANIRVNISNLPFDMEEAELKDRHVALLVRKARHLEFWQDTASTYGKVARGMLQRLEDGLS